MKTLLMPIGYPGCGKSYWANKMLEEYDIPNVSSDKMRERLYGDATIQGDYNEVFGNTYDEIRAILETCPVCILDATNVTRHVRWKAICEIDPDEVIYVIFPDDIKLAKRRNQERDRVVPNRVINKMAYSYRQFYPCPEKDFIGDRRYKIFKVDDSELYSHIEKRLK